MANLKEMAKNDERLTGGHRACAGCGIPIIVRQVMHSIKDKVVVGSATGCLEVTTTIFPYSAWKVPFLHNAFENAGATMSGVEAAYQYQRKHGKINEEIKIIAFGGDGGTYDIGFQSLSGAMERGHDMMYICYDNEAYMNTGVQRSSATPYGASTTTAPAGKVKQGKEQFRKNLTECMVAHRIPYVAQSAVGNWMDLTKKVEKAMTIKGPKFMNVLQPCQLGWQYPMKDTVLMGQLAIDTCFWPLYEVENGVYKLTYKPKEKKPITDWLKPQNRFRHLFKPGNEKILEIIQADVDRNWNELLKKCNVTA